MELAKVTLKGQITIPIEIRKKLGVKDGDKVIFFEENGRIVMENSVRIALKEVHDAFIGEAERVGLKDEQDAAAMIKESRREKQKRPNADLLEALDDTRNRRNLHGPYKTAEDAVAAMLED